MAMTATVDTLKRASAADETRKLAKLTGPDCVAFLHHVVREDAFPLAQRIRAAITLLEAAEFISAPAKAPTGLFDGKPNGET